MKSKIKLALFASILVQMPLFVLAEEGGDVIVKGFELDKLLNFGGALLATALFILTVVAYNRYKNRRLIYVSAAFLLFAIKGFLLSMEVIFGDWSWIDIMVSIFDFAILLSFFFGILKK